MFLHDKHEVLLVEKSSFILCTFVYPRCYGRLKYGKIQRTNGIQNIVYFTRVVTNERKFSWRWNIVGKLFQGMKNNLWKKWIQDNFSLSCTSVVKMLWKPDEIMQISTFWPISNSFAKIKTRWNFWILFLKTVHQKGLLKKIKKKVEFLLPSPDSWKLLTTSLLSSLSCRLIQTIFPFLNKNNDKLATQCYG